MIDFHDELGNFKQNNFYTSKCKILHFEMSGWNNTTILTLNEFRTFFVHLKNGIQYVEFDFKLLLKSITLNTTHKKEIYAL